MNSSSSSHYIEVPSIEEIERKRQVAIDNLEIVNNDNNNNGKLILCQRCNEMISMVGKLPRPI